MGNLIVNASVLPALRDLIDDGVVHSCTYEGNTITLDTSTIEGFIGKTLYSLEIELHGEDHLHFVKNLDGLLERDQFRVMPPDEYYVDDLDFWSDDGNPKPHLIEKYHDAIALVGALMQSADYYDPSTNTIVIASDRVIKIPVRFSAEDLTVSGSFLKLISFIGDKHQADNKRSLFKSVLSSKLASIEEALRMSVLLRRIDEFEQECSATLEAFMRDFTLAKLRSEVRTENVGFTKQIAAVISDVQNKILTVPAAVLLVITQYKDGGDHTLRNGVILFGALIYALFMGIMLWNQHSTLTSIREEINRQKREVEEKAPLGASEFSDIYDALLGTITRQVVFVWFVGMVIAICFMIALGLFCIAEPNVGLIVGISCVFVSVLIC